MAVPTHRFTLATTIVEQLNEFARSNIDGKRRSEIDGLWERFINDNETAIANERKRLTALGYQGDLNTKMFRSVLYYRRPQETNNGGQRNQEPQQRREYIATPGDLLPVMDEHITKNCFGEQPMTPAAGWTHFQENHAGEIQFALQALIGTDMLTSELAQEKLKKTYKNRHFLERKRRQRAVSNAARLSGVTDE